MGLNGLIKRYRKHGLMNDKTKVIVSLCDKSGNMVKPWAEVGVKCYAVDVQHSIRRDREQDNINYVWGDVRSWTLPEDEEPLIIFGFPPCTHLAGSGARDWDKKSWYMLRDGMDLFYACLHSAKWAGCPYMIENPVGRISGIHHPATHSFHPWEYGDGYQKKTCLWTGNGFVMPEPSVTTKPPDCEQKIWKMPPSADRQDKRSETPEGFAEAVFQANKGIINNDT